MRRCNLVKLLYYFHRTTGCFNSRLGFFTHCIYPEGEFFFQFTITQYFHPVSLCDQAVDIQVFEAEFSDIILKPRLGIRRWIGIWPPSCAILFLKPVRA